MRRNYQPQKYASNLGIYEQLNDTAVDFIIINKPNKSACTIILSDVYREKMI